MWEISEFKSQQPSCSVLKTGWITFANPQLNRQESQNVDEKTTNVRHIEILCL